MLQVPPGHKLKFFLICFFVKNFGTSPLRHSLPYVHMLVLVNLIVAKIFGFFIITRDYEKFVGHHKVEMDPISLPELFEPSGGKKKLRITKKLGLIFLFRKSIFTTICGRAYVACRPPLVLMIATPA